MRNSYLTFGLTNSDPETPNPPKLTVFLRHYINISYEETFLVLLKVDWSQLKPSKTLKKLKILLVFADTNKIFAFFVLFLLLIETPVS